MKTNIKLLFGACVIMAMGSCSKEAPFNGADSEGMGRLMKSAIEVDLRCDEQISRAQTDIDINDMVISFIEDGAEDPYITYTYGSMPEVITLPAGIYKAVGQLGDNSEAEFDNPYYLGSTESFRIEADKITDNIGDLVCSLSNVQVSVYFDYGLTLQMSEDTKVNVRMNDGKILSFTKQDETLERSGYYRFEPGMVMTANFIGTVEGWETNEIKTYTTINNGTHYKITFRLHSGDEIEGGDQDATIRVDGTLTSIDVDRNIEVEDELLDDSERPGDGGGKPVIPDNPDDNKGPQIIAGGDIDFDKENVIVEGMDVSFTVTSNTGFKTFIVDIDSDKLTPAELEGIGLTSHLDLINPGQYEEVLSGLGFPVNLGGAKQADFNISGFMTLLTALGPGTHKFIISVSDEEGSTTKILTLITL